MPEALHLLQKYWGFTSFRDLQEEIISEVIAGKDVLALLPTGGGKSLCFQVPALVKPGICIVISPLIALMEDQINALKEKGIKAMAITGGIPFPELDKMLDNCIYGNYKFLYMSPERLQQEIVQERIRQMDVNLIAVDESHCISQWGHDFRPAYRNISILREIKPEVNILGLTASATPPVVKDIIDQLELRGPAVIRKSFARKNIAFSVITAQDKFYHLEKLVKEHTENVIIYVRSRSATVEISSFLEKKGIGAAAYHGGLYQKEKTQRFQQWLNEEKRVMVATSAFGMGIDKANVRTVIHMNLPESLESYFQEAGRAGRDGKPSKAIILTNESDIPHLKSQFLSALPDVEYVKLVYKKILSYFRIAYGEGEGTEHFFNFADFCQIYQLNYLKAYNTLQLLDRASVLQLSQQFHKRTRFQFLIPHTQLSAYLKNQLRERLVKSILRTYGGVFENKVEINLSVIASKAGATLAEAAEILNQLHQEGIVDFENNIEDSAVTFLVPREDNATINPLIPYIKLQAERKSQKIEAVVAYVNNNTECRSNQLLTYFGEKVSVPCGICSVCKSQTEVLTRQKLIEISHHIIGLLEEKACSSREIIEKLAFEEQHIIKVLQLLVEKGAITTTGSNNFKLTHL